MTEVVDEWEFYPCRVDDAPASIFLNFAYRTSRPAGLDTLYYAGLQILDAADHGMGSEADAKLLWELEERITDAAASVGLCFVGRLRNHGDWQLTFYGPKEREAELEQRVVEALADTDRGYRVGSKPDEDWSYYEDFLLPDAERWQWIMDRRVVAQLREAGDDHSVPRPVDHFVHFADARRREAFLSAARALGFDAQEGATDDGAALPYGAALVRKDKVELDAIHEVVMTVLELAEEHGGEYDGWGAPIVKP
ncbi:MAG: DUF695 domain-containing protein [Polyangiaceae bacterium]|nr:DUF695 domain-containing protein [Polyangiaceae bacterium]